jgi:hypothetical protein
LLYRQRLIGHGTLVTAHWSRHIGHGSLISMKKAIAIDSFSRVFQSFSQTSRTVFVSHSASEITVGGGVPLRARRSCSAKSGVLHRKSLAVALDQNKSGATCEFPKQKTK